MLMRTSQITSRGRGSMGHRNRSIATIEFSPPRCVRSSANPQSQDVALLQRQLQAVMEENARLKMQLELKNGASLMQTPEVSIPPPIIDEKASATIPLFNGKTDTLRDGINWPTQGGEAQFWNRNPRSTPRPTLSSSASNSISQPPSNPVANPVHVVHITAEMAPIAKVGGLGDVVTGLARATLSKGHQVSVIMPFYECLPKDQIEGLKHEMDFDCPKGFRWDGEMKLGSLRTSVFWGKIAGVPTYLIRPADWNECNIFRGTRIYGGSYNELEAYLYLCRASLEFLKVSGQQPTILQLHDWHAAAAALLYWECYHNAGLFKPRVMLTIHNFDNSGECRQDEFMACGVHGEVFATADKALDERTIGHNPERINLMKGGIVYSNMITTVSPTYRTEVVNGGAAGWLRSLFLKPEVGAKFRGILNGIDCQEWDPATDPFLPAPYDVSTPQGKALCKEYLQRGLGMAVDKDKPLVAVVSRLVPQKGVNLLKAACYRSLSQGGQYVLLGSGHSDPAFKAMAGGEFKDHPDCKLMIMYSERLAHLIYSAADIVLVPSMFEPCGLTQMIALRYGAVPLVRKTGGLADTVFDVDDPESNGRANGFVFSGTHENDLNSTLDRAIKMYKERRGDWEVLGRRNMGVDVSWEKSSGSYEGLYTDIMFRG